MAPGVFPSAGAGVLLSAATVIRRAVNNNNVNSKVSDMTRRAAHHVPTTNHKTIRSRQAGKKMHLLETRVTPRLSPAPFFLVAYLTLD